MGAGLTGNRALQPEPSSQTRALRTPTLLGSALMPPCGVKGWLSRWCCGGAAQGGSHKGRWGHPVSGCAVPQDSEANAWHPTTEQNSRPASDYANHLGDLVSGVTARRPGPVTGRSKHTGSPFSLPACGGSTAMSGSPGGRGAGQSPGENSEGHDSFAHQPRGGMEGRVGGSALRC